MRSSSRKFTIQSHFSSVGGIQLFIETLSLRLHFETCPPKLLPLSLSLPFFFYLSVSRESSIVLGLVQVLDAIIEATTVLCRPLPPRPLPRPLLRPRPRPPLPVPKEAATRGDGLASAASAVSGSTALPFPSWTSPPRPAVEPATKKDPPT
uniref:Uncharacterized protein n=1 Tax=Odontella aurita TaxID=265563 RepID=A0A7S4M913_9STRA